jgi:hypothetical protein
MMKAKTHIRERLNSSTEESVTSHKETHRAVFDELTRLSKAHREAKTPEEKTVAKEATEVYKKRENVAKILADLREKKKGQYRVNEKAVDKLLVIVHKLLVDLIEYGITADQPKIFRENFNAVKYPSFGELAIYPAISNLVNISPPPPPRKNVYYKTAVEYGFKDLDKEHRKTTGGKDMSLASETKEFIADVVYEFVNRMSFYVKNLTDIKKVKTVTDVHVDLALQFMFYHDDPEFERHNEFVSSLNFTPRQVEPKTTTPTVDTSEVVTPAVVTPVVVVSEGVPLPAEPPARMRSPAVKVNLSDRMASRKK